MRMRRLGARLLKFSLIAGAVISVAKGFAVRQVLWEGYAPIGFDKMAVINEKLLGRPIWFVSENQIRRFLKDEMVERLEIRRKLPSTIVIVADSPQLVGIIPEGSKGTVVDERGRRWAKIPLSTTCLPFLMIPENVSTQKYMVAVKQILELCAQEGVPIRAIWLSQFGEAAIYLPEGFWLKLGNPTALKLKLRLGKLLHRNKLIPPGAVADLSIPKVVNLRELEEDSQQGR